MASHALPAALADRLQPLFDALPLDAAMDQLVVETPASAGHVALVDGLVADDTLAPTLQAALWLYVDELDRSHRISQGIDNATGAYWHGIMHRREGDFSNSHYWFRKVGRHPAMADVADYDGHAFIDQVAGWTETGAGDASALRDTQRREWMALLIHCARAGD